MDYTKGRTALFVQTLVAAGIAFIAALLVITVIVPNNWVLSVSLSALPAGLGALWALVSQDSVDTEGE